jgi:hypothetical protein
VGQADGGGRGLMAGKELHWDTASNREAETAAPPQEPTKKELDEQGWLQYARTSFDASTDYLDANIRNQWERNIRNWQGRHPVGSKYDSEDYKGRSKLFRPKTRATVRKNEAACAAAFFSSQDLITTTPGDDSDPKQLASAEINQFLLQHRLSKTIPWFLTCVGAFQDTQVAGICVSKQYWHYEERVVHTGDMYPRLDENDNPVVDDDGVEIFDEDTYTEVVADKPCIDLIPPENVRFHPASDWRDPINSTPCLHVIHPMFAGDVKARMEAVDPKTGQPQWRKLDAGQLASARKLTQDSTRQTREGNREDSKDEGEEIDDNEVLWPIENFCRWDGEDWHFWTLGTEHLLTDPKPVREVYLHGIRPYVLGIGVIETHKTIPASKVELGQDQQAELNDHANLRLDNVRLAMNGRPMVRAGKDIDLGLLRRQAPGQPILVRDPQNDIVWDRPPDVTASAYAEQDRLNLDFDEIMGAFSPGSIQANRAMNETVGGMQLLAGGANAIGEYDLRVFTETWVEPVLRQLVKLEQAYETDATILALAAKRSQMLQRLGVDQITDELLQQELTVTVNVGIAATDPMQRIQKFAAAAKILGEIIGNPAAMQVANLPEIAKEVFGAVGYKDGLRFFKLDADPQVKQLQQQVQQLTMEKETKAAETNAKLQADLARIKADSEAKAREFQLELAKLREEMQIKREDALFERRMRMEEMNFRRAEVEATTGKPIAKARVNHLSFERDEQTGKITGALVEILPPDGKGQPMRRRIAVNRDGRGISSAQFHDVA